MNYVIIGGSAAGVSAAETLRNHNEQAKITLISDETFPLYSRCLLTYLIAGAMNESELNFKDRDFYEKNNIRTLLGQRAVGIDPRKKSVSLDDGTQVAYDKLLLATGSSAQSLDIPGADKQGVFTVRKIDDARGILAMLDRVRQAAVLGGGLIGLRDAYALSLRKKQVTVVVKSPQILSQMVDSRAAEIIAAVLERNGIKIETQLAAGEILGKKAVEGIILDNGQKRDCQLVIVGKGVRPNTELAGSCGLRIEEGIVVDKFLRSSNPDIFAAGDVAQTYDIARDEQRVNALWPCAIEQGQQAALNMLGKQGEYDGSLSMNSVDFFGLPCISMGLARPKREADYQVLTRAGGEKLYKKFVLKDNKIVGMVLIGEIKSAGIVSALIRSKVDVSSIKQFLLDDNFGYAKIMPLVKEFPDKFKQEEFQDTIITY